MNDQIDVRPVVESGPFEVAILEREAQRPDQMEPSLGSGTQSGDTPRVGRDLRLDQDYVQVRTVLMSVRCDG